MVSEIVEGVRRAIELIFTGDYISAEEAYRIGLANKVVEDEKLLDTAIEIGKKIAANGPLGIELAKRVINQGIKMDIDKALYMEADNFSIVFSTDQPREGINAFFEKRTADFKKKST